MPTPAQPTDPAGSPSGVEEKGPEAKNPFSLDELGFAGTVLAAVGGGLGLLGFVAFFGAAILWIRMTESGLPGNEAVAVVPKPVLITTGAGFLVPALLVALGFTVAVFIIDSVTKWFSEEPVREKRKELRRKHAEASSFETNIATLEGVATMTVAICDGARAALQLGSGTEAQVGEAETAQRSAHAALQSAKSSQVEIQKEIAELEKQLHDLEGEDRESMENWHKWRLIGLTLALFALAATWMIVQFSITLPFGRIVFLVTIIGLLTTVVVLVRLRTNSFGWFAVATFVAVGLVVGALTYYRTRDDPQLEPAAVLRSHGAPVYGFFVAETSDRVYLGTTHPGDSVRLDSIPREEVLNLLVGELQPPAAANERALFYARNLCLRARQREATGAIVGSDKGGGFGEEVASGCTATDLQRLRAAEVH